MFIIPGYDLGRRTSTTQDLIIEHKERVEKQLLSREPVKFLSFAERKLNVNDMTWIEDNENRFLKDTPNKMLEQNYTMPLLGFIYCMDYSSKGDFICVGYSTGFIEVGTMSKSWYPKFYKPLKTVDKKWIKENFERFLKNTDNGIICSKVFFAGCGFITAVQFDPQGRIVIVGHSSGLIQMRNGITGAVICTLRRIQFPPKPVYSIKFSKTEENVCYAACMDGALYRIQVPSDALVPLETQDVDLKVCIKADPALECLKVDFYKAPGESVYASPLISERTQMFSFDITADQSKAVVGFTDSSIKVYDMQTLETLLTNKVHKLRLQYIPTKLQRHHIGSVCALKCHPDRPYMYASAAWDNTLRIWDVRCNAGCVGTFESGPIRGDAIDINRDHIVSGSWSPTEAISHWDIVAKKRINIIRVQNRRPDIDGEYLFCCRYWRSNSYNRKGKYIVVGGSGTNCLEIINIHNRYIACSYPVTGTLNAITSFEDRIAFGGSNFMFNIVKFHDPSHEKYEKEVDEETCVFDFDKYSNSSDILLPHFLSMSTNLNYEIKLANKTGQ